MGQRSGTLETFDTRHPTFPLHLPWHELSVPSLILRSEAQNPFTFISQGFQGAHFQQIVLILVGQSRPDLESSPIADHSRCKESLQCIVVPRGIIAGMKMCWKIDGAFIVLEHDQCAGVMAWRGA